MPYEDSGADKELTAPNRSAEYDNSGPNDA